MSQCRQRVCLDNHSMPFKRSLSWGKSRLRLSAASFLSVRLHHHQPRGQHQQRVWAQRIRTCSHPVRLPATLPGARDSVPKLSPMPPPPCATERATLLLKDGKNSNWELHYIFSNFTNVVMMLTSSYSYTQELANINSYLDSNPDNLIISDIVHGQVV